MRVLTGDSHVTVDYERKAERLECWGLLVIDDAWRSVKAMICGIRSSFGETSGLGSDCLDRLATEDYWNSRLPSNEPFDRTLVRLPSMLSDLEAINLICFSDFPESKGELIELLRTSESSLERKSEAYRLRWAILIDIFDNRRPKGQQQRFVEVWNLLDQVGHEPFARARFTRGGATLPRWAEEVEIVHKEPPAGGYEAHKARFVRWLEEVRGVMSREFYSTTTAQACHNPTDLARTARAKRVAVCRELMAYDPYGVWRWVNEVIEIDPVPSAAMQRWLAAKALHVTDLQGSSVPLVAIIAICSGIRYLVPHRSWDYGVESPLATVDGEALDRINTLGEMKLEAGCYLDFANALRDWLTQVEQFDRGNGRLSSIRILPDFPEEKATVTLVYSSPLPVPIFRPGIEREPGRTAHLWRRLRPFLSDHSHDGDSINMVFAWRR